MRSEDIKYVIIQAGGKGIRMGRYAENKPKCLVPCKRYSYDYEYH